MALYKASALSSPLATTRIFLACMIFLIPNEYAWRGTSASEAKKRLFASIVLSVRSTQCVSFLNTVPGSLNPMCPFLPIPRSCRSIPPCLRIFALYSAQDFSESVASPSGTKVRFLSILTWSNKYVFMK